MVKKQNPAGISSVLRWACFLLFLAVAIGWAARGVWARAGKMNIADTSAQALSIAQAGTRLDVVVRIDQITGRNLRCTLLEKVTGTNYRTARTGDTTVFAALTPETSVVMGSARDLAPGAIVQLGATVDRNRLLQVSRVVILTGYVRVAEDSKPTP